MYMTYKLKTEELDSRFLRSLRAMFKGKEIEIIVCDTAQSEEDETAYLLQSPANREHLFQAIDNATNRRHLVTVEVDKLS